VAGDWDNKVVMGKEKGSRRRDRGTEGECEWGGTAGHDFTGTGNGNWSRRSKQRSFGKMTDAVDGFGDQYYLVPA
jgi:hypothetical protein